jgi:hypothetical protein
VKKNETWKDIPGYENLYQVSNLGRVRKRIVKPDRKLSKSTSTGIRKRKRKKWHRHKQYYWILIKPWVNKSGLVVALWKDGKRSMRCIKILVADAFIPGKGKVVFNNGDESDCRRANLRRTWMKRHAKLTEQQIYHIWDTFKDGNAPRGTMSNLAREYDVLPKSILFWKNRIPEDWRNEQT